MGLYPRSPGQMITLKTSVKKHKYGIGSVHIFIYFYIALGKLHKADSMCFHGNLKEGFRKTEDGTSPNCTSDQLFLGFW